MEEEVLFTFNAQFVLTTYTHKKTDMNWSLNWNRMERFTIAKSTSAQRLAKEAMEIEMYNHPVWMKHEENQIVIVIHGPSRAFERREWRW
jgi:hypothetical protein